jgi:hypothetical protein
VNFLILEAMANICTNVLYLSIKDKNLRDKLVEEIKDKFDYNDINLSDDDTFECEMNFFSRWTFPQEEIDKLIEGLEEENDLYLRVLSYEFGCDYVGYNIYKSGEWCDMLTW